MKLEDYQKIMRDVRYKRRYKTFFTYFAFSAILAVIYWFAFFILFPISSKTSESIDMELEKLDATSKSLIELVAFLDNHKKTLKEEKQILSRLKKEKETLKPLVESDRVTVEALFIEQEKRQQRMIWRSRIEGFFIGIFTSVLGGAILLFLTRKINSNKVS